MVCRLVAVLIFLVGLATFFAIGPNFWGVALVLAGAWLYNLKTFRRSGGS